MRIRWCGGLVAIGMATAAWAQGDACETDDGRIIADNPLATRLDAFVATLPEGGVSGTVMIARDRETLLSRGFGCARPGEGVANAPNTLFDIGSIAKAFTSAMVLRLRDEGRLQLDDTIAEHLDRVPEDKSAITIRQLLSHSAGLPAYHASGDFVRMDKAKAVEASLSEDLLFEPGTDTGYSNAGYALLAAIVESVTEESFADSICDAILEPLELSDTGWYPDFEEAVGRTAQGVIGDRVRAKDVTRWRRTWALIGGGGMLSTTGDLARFTEALFHGDLLSEQSKRDIREVATGSWTCGWQHWKTDAGRTIEKGGANNYGFTSIVQVYPDSNTMVVLLCNSKPNRDTLPHQEVSAKIGSLLAAE